MTALCVCLTRAVQGHVHQAQFHKRWLIELLNSSIPQSCPTVYSNLMARDVGEAHAVMSVPCKKCWPLCGRGPGRTCSPVAAHAGTVGCRLTLEEPVLPGLPASLPSCPHHLLLILLQTAQPLPARAFMPPYSFTHFKNLLVRMFFLLPTALLTALLMWFFSHLPVKICWTALHSPF